MGPFLLRGDFSGVFVTRFPIDVGFDLSKNGVFRAAEITNNDPSIQHQLCLVLRSKDGPFLPLGRSWYEPPLY